MFQRPPSITFMAYLGCFLGAVGLFCSPFQALGLLVDNSEEMAAVSSNYGIPVPILTPTARVFMGLYYLLSAAISGIQLAGAAGSFGMKPWARKCINTYGALQIGNSVLYALINVLLLYPSMMPQLATFAPGLPPGMMGVVGVVSALLNLLLGSCFAIVFLYIYNTRANREAFANGGIVAGHPYYAPVPPPGYGYPGYPPQGQYPQQVPPTPGYPGYQPPPAGAPGYQQPAPPQYQQAPPPQYPQAPPGYQQVPPGYQPVPPGPPRDPGPLPPPGQQPPQYPPQG